MASEIPLYDIPRENYLTQLKTTFSLRNTSVNKVKKKLTLERLLGKIIYLATLILVESYFPRGTTNQKHYPNLGSEASSVWNFCTRFSDVILRGNQCWRWRRKISTVFSGYQEVHF